MKVLLNIESLAAPLSGIGTYTYNLANQLNPHKAISSMVLFTRNGWRVQENTATDQAHLGTAPTGVRSVLRRLPLSYAVRDRVIGFRLRMAKFAQRGYIYHEPNYIPVPYEGPSVVTISDLSHIHYPHFHPRERVRRLERNLAPAVANAAQVICHSRFVKAEILEHLGVGEDKVNVVYLGVAPEYCPRSPQEVGPVLARHGLEAGRYVLSVATIEPRKNLRSLIHGYRRLPASLRREYPLILVGQKGWLTRSTEEAMAPLMAEGTLRWLGHLPFAELAPVYAGAGAFAYLSLYEGFGLPIIEAMATGIPVLCSNRAAMPEVAQDAALLVDPLAIEEIAQGLERLLTDIELRARLSDAGLTRARDFSWESSAHDTIEVYRKALRPSRELPLPAQAAGI